MSVTKGTASIKEKPIAVDPHFSKPIVTDTSMEQPITVDGSSAPATAEVCVSKQKGRKPISTVWKHCSKVFEEGTKIVKGATCNYCAKFYSWVSENGTSTLRKHLLKCNKNPYNREVKKQKTLTSFGSVKGASENGLGLWQFDQNRCRDALVRMLIKDELPFMFVEREGFRSFCSVMQPNFKQVSRFTMARDCVAVYADEREKMKNMLKKSNQRVCITTDTWTSLQNVSYTCVTAHFIDKDWELHKRIINFCVISSHKGEAIGKALEACLIEWGVDRLCTITVDNASANDVAISYLKRKLSKNSDTFILGGEYLHVRCCSHILNLIVRDGLNEIKYSINRIRGAVKYLRSSPQREQRFKACVEKERIISKSLLCLDVPTRWNSTFLMLSAAIKFQKAFERLEDEDPHYPLELSDGCPTTGDWDDARYFSDFLEKFYAATVRLSGSSYVTSNLYFSEVCAIENFLTEWKNAAESLSDVFVSIGGMATKMKAKFDKYWGKIEKMNMLLLIAAMLDPHLKMRYVKFCYSELYGSTMADVLTTKVRDALNCVYDEYHKLSKGSLPSSQASFGMEVHQPSLGSEQVVSFQSKFQKHLEEVENDGGKSEIDKYLEEACEKDASVDVLKWWKMNSSKYKVLSEVARDVLAIPVSSVASEAAFSTGGRVIDQFRSSLTPKLVECLICMQDWFRATPFPFELEENMAEMEEFELALNNVERSSWAAICCCLVLEVCC